MMKEAVFDVIESSIKKEATFLEGISQEIWKFPELRFEEKKAHDLLTNALESKGFHVEKHFILPTAFRAEFSSQKPGPVVAVICEYDALPKIGHACGHNLIAESGLGAGIAIKYAMQALDIPGKVVVLGTPAEEGGGGKIVMINKGAFKDVDVALMVHPSPDNHLYPPFIAINRVTVTFTGKEAHASGFPWEGINALDAAVACYNNLALLRQHIKPTCRIHAIITKGGEAPNIIPGLTEMLIQYRAATTGEMKRLQSRIAACINSAAKSTGCEVKVTNGEEAYESLMTNKILAERYKLYAEKFGVKFDDGDPKKIPFMASSDMGNVSHILPSIHPTYSIGSRAPNHSGEFTEAASTAEAHRTTLIAAKSMALLAIDVLTCPEFLQKVKEQYRDDTLDDVEQ